MTAPASTRPSRPPQTEALPGHPVRRRDSERRRLLFTAAAGIGLIALIASALVMIFDAFNGDFSRYIEVRADLPVGQPIEPRSQVQFRQIQVGQVGRMDRTLPGGAIEVTLQIKPDQISRIPSNVEARVAPTSLFGTETVVLESPPGPSLSHLTGRVLIPAAGGSASLQGTLTNLNDLLTGLHPAEIDSTLGALSEAFQGQGQAAGDAIGALNSYLSGLIPELPALNGDIDLLTPVLNGLSASIPALLDVADNSAAVARTITDDQTLIGGLLADGAQLSGTSSVLLTDISASMHGFLANLEPLLGDFNASPDLPATILKDLNTLTTSFLPALTSSPVPSVSVAVTEYVNSPYEAYLAGADMPGFTARQKQQIAHAAFQDVIDPPTYTAADCPRYAGVPGPNCPGASPATGASATSASGAAPPPAPAGERASSLTLGQQNAIDGLFTSLTGHPPAQPATDSLLLAPLVQGLIP